MPMSRLWMGDLSRVAIGNARTENAQKGDTHTGARTQTHKHKCPLIFKRENTPERTHARAHRHTHTHPGGLSWELRGQLLSGAGGGGWATR